MEQWIGIEDPGLQKIIDDIVERLARTVVNTITLLAPDKVIIYGFMFEMDHIQKRFLDFCTYYDSLYDGDYILKSGETQANAGTASTSSSPSRTGGEAAGSSGGSQGGDSGDGAGSDSPAKKSQSMLFGVASGMDWI